LPRCTRSAVWRCAVESLGTVAVPVEWSIVLVLYCSRNVAAYLHALWVFTALPSRTSYRRCQAPWKLARVRWEHACLDAHPGLLGFSLFMRPVAHREPWDKWQRRSSPHPGGEVWSHRTVGSTGVNLCQDARSEAIGYVAASEPTSVGRQGPEP
jgi:hypothetical protein